MPKLTDARRQMRRGQINQAALRCFVRNGIERTSIADITAESGLSPGSIYAHYRSKAEIVQASAQHLLQRRLDTLTGFAASDVPPSPARLLDHLAAAIDPDEARVGLQTWGEATTDPAIRDIVVTMTDRMRDAIAAACAAWLVKVHGGDPAEVPARAAGLARQLMALYQAQLIRSALSAESGGGHGPTDGDLLAGAA
ncbi:TetR/AcrR family transcriptional regulator [Catellatospora sp. KI3]|uniref:TetR/AcrR family transcriptional regulator n=1 Tax=Catellatospora sp. KI3 TaxID=3041620 RepID=UPI00248274E6|nr:TetR/AcrR family transcriptional regulator [Catellatospora sp. KI3]MDI1463550.1 TetR/AcrR family transcriptional regulator [Catellatospora sp. KI3]